MKYCLSVGIHNLFFDIAIVNDKHELVSKRKEYYDRNKDISSNIYNSYMKYFSKYNIEKIGVGISNNVAYKDDFLYKVTAFAFNRYNLRQSLFKLFKKDIFIYEDTHLSALAISYEMNIDSLLYVILDNKISNSLVIKNEIIELEDDIDFKKNHLLNDKCGKNSLKNTFLVNGFDDEYVGGYFLSNDSCAKKIVSDWISNLEQYLKKIIKEIPVQNVVFGGYLGEYYEKFKDYMKLDGKLNCNGTSSHRALALIGISHLIFKDK